ncbi:hypothetical protein BGZ99_007745 [Dissophora globulifera]|uniref:Uncharacterized protein n=1 Tax=Dissophora globulifera TaxID=979702 RepID=A0A9P6RCP1_9FUNG|nr:hypothetical protein BGZ99_007745 [Dissophora globulifera]
MSKATIERRAIGIFHDFQRARKVWGDLVSDGLSQANALVNVQLQQGYADSPGYWPPALDQFLDLKQRFEDKLRKRAEAIALDLQTTFSKMSAQYSKMKLQASQLEYLMEEATEMFGEAFTFRDPFRATCTLEQIWIELEKVLCLYTRQISLNREIVDQLLSGNLQYRSHSVLKAFGGDASLSQDSQESKMAAVSPTSIISTNATSSTHMPDQSSSGAFEADRLTGSIPPPRRDKNEGMVLLSAWLNQPHLEAGTIATFDDFLQVELFDSE